MFTGEMLLPSENTEQGLEKKRNLCADGNIHAIFKLPCSSLQGNSRQFTAGQNQCIQSQIRRLPQSRRRAISFCSSLTLLTCLVFSSLSSLPTTDKKETSLIFLVCKWLVVDQLCYYSSLEVFILVLFLHSLMVSMIPILRVSLYTTVGGRTPSF